MKFGVALLLVMWDNTAMKTKPPDKDFGVLTGGFSSVRAGDRLVKVDGWQPIVCGFDSRPALCLLPRWELALLPGPQTRTTEAVEPDTSILRSSACVSKKGHVDEPERRARARAC